MLKINKSIHFNILTIFAIVFVCVYLYYTISDLKKIVVEVKKHSTDINNIITSLATLNKDIGDLKKKAASCCPTGGAGGACALPVKPTAAAQVVPPVQVTQVTAAATAPAVVDDDVSSVDTNDVKNLLSDIPDDDDVAGHDEVDNDDTDLPVVAPAVPAATAAAKKDFSSLTLEELKTECRNAGLSTKGNKDALIARLSA